MGVLWTVLSLLDSVLVALAIVMILRRPREPRAMMAWILALLLLPIVGLVAFALIGQPRLERTLKRRRRRRGRLALSLSKREAALEKMHAIQLLERMEADPANLMRLTTRVSSYPPTCGNQVEIYVDEQRSMEAILQAIGSARSHVHLEYYIFKSDETGGMVRDALVAAAQRGVECRLLIDYIGSWGTPRKFLRSMRAAGVQVAYFLPVVPWQGRWRVNFRNHRKFLIVDGRYVFAGSHNIGNEYRGTHPTLGPWHDTNLSVRGPAAQQFQEVFVEDWNFSTRIELLSDAYFPPHEAAGEHIVQVVPSGPDREISAIQDVAFAAVNAARRSVRFMTPYFVPDTATLQAMQSAAYRGVHVQIIIPSRTDSRLALWAGRSFYPDLCRAGVEIYEYDGGMLHNKVAVVDGCWSMVGSANLDHRSFRINFEIGTILYDPKFAQVLLRDFESFMGRARRITCGAGKEYRFIETLILGAARLVSPLL